MEKMVRHITRSLFVPLLPEEKEEEVKSMLELIKLKQKSVRQDCRISRSYQASEV